jgi:cell wall-associated NlpC family hydrolase
MTFTRLGRGDLLAMVAALALLLVMAMDWYTTKLGEQARDVQSKIQPQVNNQTVPSESAKEGAFADSQEKNAWQADALIDRLILIALVAAAVLAVVAAWARAAGRQVRIGRWSPSTVASVIGVVACSMLVYRILQPPGVNSGAVVKAGAPLGLLCVGLLAIGARVASRGERATEAASPT